MSDKRKDAPTESLLNTENIDDSSAVGYGRPPKATQFKKGQSGNPKGRPKGKRNLQTDVMQLLAEKLPITENGIRKVRTVQQITLRRLRAEALRGDKKAMDSLIKLAMQFNNQDDAVVNDIVLTPVDHELLDDFARKRAAKLNGAPEA